MHFEKILIRDWNIRQIGAFKAFCTFLFIDLVEEFKLLKNSWHLHNFEDFKLLKI